ncbi:MAG TPA: hypothetical protein VN238_02775 [Solirubrobacteraceae bacterium]|nr:hypothetical protein [Solirubrobacteraceae bacterium]
MRASRPVLLALACVVALAAGAGAIALAQSVPITLRADVQVAPNKAGTPSEPQGVRLSGTAWLDLPGDFEPPLVQNVDVWIGPGGRYNGGKHAACSLSVISRGGPSKCPSRSLMGRGTATASADTVPTYPKITIVNGGASTVYFYTVMTNPARVQAPVIATVRRASGKWAYKVQATIPRNLQIVAGVPILLKKLQMAAGRGDWIATTSCPRDKRWRYHAEVTFKTGQVVKYDGSVPCR